MNKPLLFSALAAAFLAAGCATDSATTSSSGAERAVDASPITGSRIPRRGDENAQGVRVSSPDDLSRAEALGRGTPQGTRMPGS
jgi:hypothetical protein